jgi:hypothetical protein
MRVWEKKAVGYNAILCIVREKQFRATLLIRASYFKVSDADAGAPMASAVHTPLTPSKSKSSSFSSFSMSSRSAVAPALAGGLAGFTSSGAERNGVGYQPRLECKIIERGGWASPLRDGVS